MRFKQNTVYCRDLVEDPISFTELAIERIREKGVVCQVLRASFTSGIAEEDQFMRGHYRKRTEYYSVQKAEDRCVCSDKERERQDCDHREAGTLRQLAHGVTQIVPDVVDISK